MAKKVIYLEKPLKKDPAPLLDLRVSRNCPENLKGEIGEAVAAMKDRSGFPIDACYWRDNDNFTSPYWKLNKAGQHDPKWLEYYQKELEKERVRKNGKQSGA